jgi:RNA polymerase sigma-70 factor (ECF subfamily)
MQLNSLPGASTPRVDDARLGVGNTMFTFPPHDAVAALGTPGAETPPGIARLLESYRHHLRAVADRQLGSDLKSKVDASDVVQDTCLDAFREDWRFDGLTAEEAKAMLIRILIRNVQTLARQYRGTGKRDVRREVSLDYFTDGNELAAEGNGGRTTPADAAATRDDWEKLSALMARLPDRQREALVWRARDDRTFREIGDRLGCSGVAARKLCLKVVERLRRELGRVGA